MISVSIHPRYNDARTARAKDLPSASCLEIKVGDTDVTIFGDADDMPAFDKIADLFNEAFAKPEPVAVAAPAVDLDDSDIPF